MTWPARLPTIARIDWFKVLMDLKRAGLSLKTTAMFVETSKGAVIGWKDQGCEPSYHHGERLLMLWMRATGLNKSDAPVMVDETKIKPGVRPERRYAIGCPMCGNVGQMGLPFDGRGRDLNRE